MTSSDAPATMLTGVLSRERLLQRIVGQSCPLVEGVLDVDSQVQPNGIDLTLQSIARHNGSGRIGVSNSDRVLPDLVDLVFDADGWIELMPGVYHIVYNEIVNIPVDLMALGRPRSSLGRIGVTIHTAVWDAGYRGRSTSLLSVINPAGFQVQRNARVMQLVFFGLAKETATGYSGAYQNENTTG